MAHVTPSERAIAELANEVGLEVATALAQKFGGTRLYVPRNIGEHHPIYAALGKETASLISDLVGGGSIDIPKMAANRARVYELRSQGALTIRQIALDTDFSERHVYRLLREKLDEAQGSFFD